MRTGADFRALREQQGASRNEIAQATGLKSAAIGRIETRESFKEGEAKALDSYYGADASVPQTVTQEPESKETESRSWILSPLRRQMGSTPTDSDELVVTRGALTKCITLALNIARQDEHQLNAEALEVLDGLRSALGHPAREEGWDNERTTEEVQQGQVAGEVRRVWHDV